jgi:hypothetical protein
MFLQSTRFDSRTTENEFHRNEDFASATRPRLESFVIDLGSIL